MTPFAMHADAVRHRERFTLVVGDEERGDAEPALQPLEFDLHLVAKLRVEIGERLVEQQHAGMRRECTRDGDPLLLPA